MTVGFSVRSVRRAVKGAAFLGAALLWAGAVFATGPFGSLVDIADERDELVELRFRWISDISQTPAFVTRLERRLAELRTSAREQARYEEESARATMRPFRPLRVEELWDYAGETDRLSSLVGTTWRFSNTALPVVEHRTLLWDRQTGRAISITDLFELPQALSAFGARFCAELYRQRIERLGRPQPGPCPAIETAVVAPAGIEHPGFDLLHFSLAPGIAGPWAEGGYLVALPLTETDLRLIRRDYRSEFVAAQPQ